MATPAQSEATHRTVPGRDTKVPWSSDNLLDRLGSLFIVGSTVVSGVVGYWQLGPVASFPLCMGTTAVAMGLFELFEPPLRGARAERRVRRLLRRHAVSAVHDVFLSTPEGRRAQFDYVVFLGRAVAVIETKSIEGIVERRQGRWSRWLYGRESPWQGSTPQQQVMRARDVLAAAYPAWRGGILAWTVVAHGTLGEGLAGDVWVVGFDELALALGRFRQVPDEAAQRRWHDLSRFLGREPADKPRQGPLRDQGNVQVVAAWTLANAWAGSGFRGWRAASLWRDLVVVSSVHGCDDLAGSSDYRIGLGCPWRGRAPMLDQFGMSVMSAFWRLWSATRQPRWLAPKPQQRGL